MSIFHVFPFDRHVVRLGEHNLSSTTDGMHQDIRIYHAEPHDKYEYQDIRIYHAERHDKYDEKLDINDIAILTLVRNVTFSGKLNIFIDFNFEKIKYIDSIFIWFLLQQI